MTSQQSDGSTNIGQNILLVAIIVVLVYIVLDIFGFIPSMKTAGNRNRKGGSTQRPAAKALSRQYRHGRSAVVLLVLLALVVTVNALA
jgi:hypothetical protein